MPWQCSTSIFVITVNEGSVQWTERAFSSLSAGIGHFTREKLRSRKSVGFKAQSFQPRELDTEQLLLQVHSSQRSGEDKWQQHNNLSPGSQQSQHPRTPNISRWLFHLQTEGSVWKMKGDLEKFKNQIQRTYGVHSNNKYTCLVIMCNSAV